MKKLLLILLILFILVGCTNNNLSEVKSDDYDESLFYVNDLEQEGADPSVIYISEGEEAGYYYMYITSDEIEVRGYLAYRSKDLDKWEKVGTVFGYKKETKEDGNTYMTCGVTDYWAPEVIYDKETKLYYLFYSANQYNAPKGEEYYFYGDVAVSDSPKGPFVQYREYYGMDAKLVDEKKNLYVYEPLFDFSNMDINDPLYEKYTDGYMKIIDLSPFIDPVTNKKYLYFTRDLYSPSHATESKIMVIELNDDFTPKYDTVKELTNPNRNTVDGERNENLKEGRVNEGSFTIYKDGKYYLTYSCCSYMLRTYSVRVAVSDSPTGPFTKLNKDEGGFLLGVDKDASWIAATGHASIVSKDDKYYIVYHASQCRFNDEFVRAIAFDELVWTTNDDGLQIPYVNGPSYALLPLYTNGNKDVKDYELYDLEKGDNLSYLNDNVIKFRNDNFVKETIFASGKNTITLELNESINLKAIMIFNGFDSEQRLDSIKDIVVYTDDGSYHSGELVYDYNRYTNDNGVVIPGGNFTLGLENKEITKIEIVINADKEYALSEIKLIG